VDVLLDTHFYFTYIIFTISAKIVAFHIQTDFHSEVRNLGTLKSALCDFKNNILKFDLW
jgi:hypothetical protein